MKEGVLTILAVASVALLGVATGLFIGLNFDTGENVRQLNEEQLAAFEEFESQSHKCPKCYGTYGSGSMIREVQPNGEIAFYCPYYQASYSNGPSNGCGYKFAQF